MTKALLIGRTARVGLDSDEEASLEVGESVEVEEEVVDLILSDDVVGLDLALVVLENCETRSARPCETRRTPSAVKDS